MAAYTTFGRTIVNRLVHTKLSHLNWSDSGNVDT